MADADRLPTLSLVTPVFNERATLPAMLKRLEALDLPVPWELLIVDDGSTDGGVEALGDAPVPGAQRVVIDRHAENRGKGWAVRRGFELARGHILGVQDADLEYDPAQIPALIAPILDGRADAVFGSREFGAHSAYSFWYVMGNRLINLVAGSLFNRYLTDVYTGYKFVSRSVYERLRLTADGFDIEAELTAELLRHGVRVFEVPITYVARDRAAGKKIRARDGLRGLVRLIRVRLRRR